MKRTSITLKKHLANSNKVFLYIFETTLITGDRHSHLDDWNAISKRFR